MVTRSAQSHCDIMGRRRYGDDPEPEDLLANRWFCTARYCTEAWQRFWKRKISGTGPGIFFF